ncbi:MAG: hypothetical protein GX552_07795 [Chloroflexi bacterium]|jgi:hypothetical protein|nr:hypothetical protein [Chloroflexota bacterium]
MQPAFERQETGAALVQTALLLVVLLLFVGLAVDVGSLYAVRRHMQNAADAGALAGARAICFSGDPIAAATDYAQNRNGADTTLVEVIDGYQVRVVATRAATTYFMGLAGLDTIDVSAEATAACGVAESACGVWPIAFSVTIWEKSCSDVVAVWDDDKIEPDCTLYNCDLDGDGDNDIVAGGDRGWLDFSEASDSAYGEGCSKSGCGADELKCLIVSDYGAKLSLPVCVPGASGVKAAAWHAAKERQGAHVIIPLYDSIGCTSAHDCPGGLRYNIVRFGCATVVEATTARLSPVAGTGPVQNAKVILMRIDCDHCDTRCGSAAASPPGPKDVTAVSLLD